jgi:transposase
MLPVIKEIGIPGYRFIRAQTQPTVTLTVEVRHRPKTCPCCGSGRRCRSKGKYERRAKHLDLFGRPTSLTVKCRRFRCVDCGKTFVQPLPGIQPGRRSSEPFRERVYEQHDDGICVSTVARKQAIGQATVGRIYAQFTERKARERESLDCPYVLGIDEHSLHKKQRFATTFCDLKNRRVFEVVPGKSERELEPFLRRLKGREKVRVVCIDMSSSYRAIVRKWFPRAKIVADRFHVVRLVMQHLLGLGRDLCPQLNWKRSWLNLLRTRRDRLAADRQHDLDRLLREQPVLAPIHALKEKLCALLCLRTQTPWQCQDHIRSLFAFITTLESSGFEQAQRLAKTLTSWTEEIVRMWRFTRNNGVTEGFHRKMKLIQRRAYGFRNFNNYRLRVIAQCG